MYREPNLGITISCAVCGRSFWTEDGVPICSSSCSDAIECQNCGEEKDPEKEYCESCCECPECGEYKSPDEKYCEGDHCPDADEEEEDD